MSKLLIGLLLLFLPLPAFAQMPSPEVRNAKLEAMQKLDFLVGDWEGKGWFAGPRGRSEVWGTESVRSRLEGLVIVVEGHFMGNVPGSEEAVPVHHAFGVLSYDQEGGHYRVSTHLANGLGGDFTATMPDDHTIIWGDPNRVRYTMDFSKEGQWHEIGEYTPDGGTTWTQFMEMTLHRQADPEQ